MAEILVFNLLKKFTHLFLQRFSLSLCLSHLFKFSLFTPYNYMHHLSFPQFTWKDWNSTLIIFFIKDFVKDMASVMRFFLLVMKQLVIMFPLVFRRKYNTILSLLNNSRCICTVRRREIERRREKKKQFSYLKPSGSNKERGILFQIVWVAVRGFLF